MPSIREPTPPPNPHPFLAAGLAGASGNGHAAAKLSRQTRMRCALLLVSHPCHLSPPPEPFLSPEAGHSLAHGRHLGLKTWPTPTRCSSCWTEAPRSPQESGLLACSSRIGLRFCSDRFCHARRLFVCLTLWDFAVVCRVPATAGESRDFGAQ